MSWLRIPRWMLEGFTRAMPKIEAQLSLRRASEAALGAGMMKKRDATELQRRWMREAAWESSRRQPVSMDLERFSSELGISIEKVKA